MAMVPILTLLAAWLVPVVRILASRGKTQPQGHAWLVATCVCLALFYTLAQDVSADILAHWLGRGTVYALCSLVSLVTLVVLLRYQQLYQHTIFASRAGYIGNVHVVYRLLTILWPLAAVTIGVVEGVWFRAAIDQQALKPLAIVLDQGPLVISRTVLLGGWIVGLWVGITYPCLYLVWQRHRLDPAFHEQGGHWRLACLAAATGLASISALVHLSATVASYLRPEWTMPAQTAASAISTVNGPLLATGVLIGCLPQRVFWSMRSYLLYRRLLPLHTQMRGIISGIYLDVSPPQAWEVVLDPVQPILSLSRLRAEITDARFMCYGEANMVRPPRTYALSVAPARALSDVARFERGVLIVLAQGETCPPEAAYLRTIRYQSLDYYLLLAKVLQPPYTTTSSL
jgi:predicted membrane protein